MDAANPELRIASSRDGSGLRNRLDLGSSSPSPTAEASSPNLRVEDRVEIGAERLPFRKRRFTTKNPLAGFFERARARLQEFLDASQEAKAAREAEEEQSAEDEAAPPAPPDEDPDVQSAQGDRRRSSLQDLFKSYEASKAYGTRSPEPPSAR